METCERCGLTHAADVPCPVLAHLRAPAEGSPLPVGTVVAGRYRIDVVLQWSRMSAVYQAADLRAGGVMVALKECNVSDLPAQEREEGLKWLAREAGLLSVLDHPQLPKLLGSASEGDRHFVAMPFISGETLEERVRCEGSQAEANVLRWAAQLCSLLVYLHQHCPPVIHRDLKPANVKLHVDGTVTLLDLGVSRPLARGIPGTAVGTPGYAPPEQYQGLADERSDLYALGATMHRLLTGYDPDQEAPFRHPPVRDLNPAVSQATAALVASLLHVAPELRPDSATQVEVMLKRAMQDGPREFFMPLYQMQRWLWAYAAAGTVLSTALYVHWFGAPFGERRWQGAPLADAGKVFLAYLPLLFLYVPLLGRVCRGFLWNTVKARRYYAVLLAAPLLIWGTFLVLGELILIVHRHGNLEALSGPNCIWACLAFPVTSVLVIATVDTLGRWLPDSRHSRHRLSTAYFFSMVGLMCGLLTHSAFDASRNLASPTAPYLSRSSGVSGTVLPFRGTLGSVPSAVAASPTAFPVATYTLVIPPFTNIQTLATDARGDLYVFDTFGVRERTPDGSWHTLAAFGGANLPCAQSALGDGSEPLLMTASADGNLYLVQSVGRQVFQVLGSGELRFVMQLPYMPEVVAAGPKHELFFMKDASGTIYGTNLETKKTTIAATIPQSHGLAPAGLAIDKSGTFYEVAGEALWAKSPGQVTRQLSPAAFGLDWLGWMTVTTGSSGDVYAATGRALFRIDARGAVHVLPSGEYDDESRAILTAAGSTLYVTTTAAYAGTAGGLLTGADDRAGLYNVPAPDQLLPRWCAPGKP